MKFVVSSIELLGHLQAVSRVINAKNTLPILDNVLFKLEGNKLELTASDLESTLITSMELENVSEEGSIALPARLLLDTLKEFPDQPLTFDINEDTLAAVISSENGQFSIVGQNHADFPKSAEIDEATEINFELTPEILLNGITNAIFATAEDELRPVMNGVYVELSSEGITFVASDAHKLVRYKRTDATSDSESSFVLPKKPASLLKNILPKETGSIIVKFDNKNAYFNLPHYTLICRLAEGKYPSYSTVIPDESPNKMIIDRVKFFNALKRVSVFSNQASNLVKLEFTGNQVTVSAQDIDFSISAYERIPCQYDGDEFNIGFKSLFLIEILQNLQSSDVVMELLDGSRAGILLPVDNENENEDILMLLMPMMVGN